MYICVCMRVYSLESERQTPSSLQKIAEINACVAHLDILNPISNPKT